MYEKIFVFYHILQGKKNLFHVTDFDQLLLENPYEFASVFLRVEIHYS
jgi:hypothetical protein